MSDCVVSMKFHMQTISTGYPWWRNQKLEKKNYFQRKLANGVKNRRPEVICIGITRPLLPDNEFIQPKNKPYNWSKAGWSSGKIANRKIFFVWSISKPCVLSLHPQTTGREVWPRGKFSKTLNSSEGQPLKECFIKFELSEKIGQRDSQRERAVHQQYFFLLFLGPLVFSLDYYWQTKWSIFSNDFKFWESFP